MVRTFIRDRYTLKTVSEKADAVEDAQLIRDLEDTLDAYSHYCLGVAANMIGVNKRVIAFVDTSKIIPEYKVMINPVITRKVKPFVAREECMCLRGKPRKCKRYEKIKVRYYDKEMQLHEERFEGETAEVIQHEIDHCNGIMI